MALPVWCVESAALAANGTHPLLSDADLKFLAACGFVPSKFQAGVWAYYRATSEAAGPNVKAELTRVGGISWKLDYADSRIAGGAWRWAEAPFQSVDVIALLTWAKLEGVI